MKYLWKFCWDCGRMGELEGLFVATEEEIENAHGREVYFGEVLGKHSGIWGTFGKEDVRKVDVDPEVVAEVSKELGDTWCGYNPLGFINEGEDE